MTNEEKAREIYNITYEQCIKDGYPEKVDIACAIMGKMGAEIMAKWKDEELDSAIDKAIERNGNFLRQGKITQYGFNIAFATTQNIRAYLKEGDEK